MARPAEGRTQALEFERPIVELEDKIAELARYAESTDAVDLGAQIEAMRRRLDDLVRDIFAGLTPWQRVLIARHPSRPTFTDIRGEILTDWIELHGDRAFGDDPALATGFARLDGRKLMVVAHRKGRTTKERVACNFGMPQPEGYRKALRKMRLAEKLGLPILAFINTPGAYPGVGAEERGQAHAIAENLFAMSRLRVPIVCVVLAEGGSGGALGIGVGDRVLMLENAYYSVISPEGCAAILWKTSERAAEAAEILKLTADDLRRFGVVHRIVAEPAGGAHRNPRAAAMLVKVAIQAAFAELDGLSADRLVEERYAQLRAIGAWMERTDLVCADGDADADADGEAEGEGEGEVGVEEGEPGVDAAAIAEAEARHGARHGAFEAATGAAPEVRTGDAGGVG